MSSERYGFMSIRLGLHWTSTIRQTTRSESCNSLRLAPVAPFSSVVGCGDARAGTVRNVYLVVTDIQAARDHLLERGVKVGEIRHKTPIGKWEGGFKPGLDPARGDYASFANFADPDGNGWVLQERGYRAELSGA